MLVLITYDICSDGESSIKRSRKIAKECMDYGQKIHTSLFECDVDATQYLTLKTILLDSINLQKDSIRFYILGNKYKTKIETFGINTKYDPEGILIL